jgi:hypothetical protein
MGIGPHAGGASVMFLKNLLLANNGLAFDSGYAHNALSDAAACGDRGRRYFLCREGQGRRPRSEGPRAQAGNLWEELFLFRTASSIDIPDGTAKPCIIAANANGGTTVEKSLGLLDHHPIPLVFMGFYRAILPSALDPAAHDREPQAVPVDAPDAEPEPKMVKVPSV